MTARSSLKQPELLAPAGSLEACFAALDAGADAVYLGLKEFSARAKAKNFSLGEVKKLTWLLQAQGKKLYVTLNTLIKEGELPQLIEVLAALEDIGVDALIIQDLAVWKLARDYFPGLELHASTQLTIHNSAGVKMLERMGFTRGVLARELTLEEITAIRRETCLELEHFVHGALCFSFSGQCYFSSFLSGKSGNRGRCAQPCRRLHHYRRDQGYYFSPNDLSAIELLPELTQAGICSFKIEGRMKSAEYVHKVVRAYRQVLEAESHDRSAVLAEAKQLLRESFGRQPTKGFLSGSQPNDLAIPAIKGATGRYLGEINRVQGGDISFKSKEQLHVGDRVRVQPATDRSGTAFTIRQLLIGKRPVGTTRAGQLVTLTSTFNQQFKPGDAVFLVSSKSAFTLSDAACRRKLEQVVRPPDQVDLQLTVTAEQLSIRAQVAGREFHRQYAIDSFPARQTPLSREVLLKTFAATAEIPLTLGRLECGKLPKIVIPPKQLKQIRRDFYAQLNQGPTRPSTSLQQRDKALAALLPSAQPLRKQRRLRILIRDAREQKLLQEPMVSAVIIPLIGSNFDQAGKLKRRAKHLIWDIPFVLFDPDWKQTQRAVMQLTEMGFSAFRLNNLGHFPLFDDLQGLTLYSSFRLFSLNSQAFCALAELGIAEAELYIEDDRDNLARILSRALPIPPALTVYAETPLLTSRIAIKNVRSDAPLLSDRGDAFRVHQRQGLTWLSSETDFSFIGNLAELEQWGCHNFVVDLSHLGATSQQGKQVLEAVQRGIDPPGSSKFNYETELE